MGFIQNLWAVMLELAPWLLVGAAVSGLIHVILPHDFVRRHLSGRGSIVKAVALGVPLPLCSCGVIPAGLGLKRDGASDAASVSFLISTPQTGVDSILVSAAFLGWPFALFKVGAATITGLTGGWLTEQFGGERKSFVSDDKEHTDPANRDWRSGVDHAEDLVRSIWGWLLFGVAVSAAISTWVSTDGIMSLSDWGPVLTMLLMLVISLPLYVCATASVPIAASLVAGGMPTGTALVFLMAGPATNLATIGAMHRAFGGRILSLYLGTIISGSLGLGLLYDAWFPTTVTTVAEHGEHMSWWAVGSAGLLVLMLCKYALSDSLSWLNRRRIAKHTGEGRVVISVEGMTCGGCVARLERELKAANGVSLASVTLDPGQAIVEGSLDQTQVAELIDTIGFKPVV